MKLIIEEGDVIPWVPLGPGVYEVEIDVEEIEMLGDNPQKLTFNGTMDAAVTQAIQAGAAMYTTSRLPPVTWVDLRVNGKKKRLVAGDVIEEPGSYRGYWTIIDFPSTTTWSCTASLNGQEFTSGLVLLAADLEIGKKIVRPTVTVTCD